MALYIDPNQTLVFFCDPDRSFTPMQLKEVLLSRGLTVDGDEEPYVIRWGEGPRLYGSIIRGEVAGVLAGRLMGGRRKHLKKAIASDSYIAIKFENLDEVLDEMNTLIEVQATLQKATDGLMYNSWNQRFS